MPSVFNHYRRIEPHIAAAAEPPAPEPAPPPTANDKDSVLTSFDADFATTNAIPDATRVVGAEDGSDPTLTHGTLSREEKWGMSPNKAGEYVLTGQARGDGYFSSRRPPTLLGKVKRRMPESADPVSSENEVSKSEERARKRKNEEERREARRIDDEARAKRIAELDEAMGRRPLPEELDVVVEKSNVLVVYVLHQRSSLHAVALRERERP